MNALYLILLLASALIPVVLSFDKKLQFYKQWEYLFPSIIIVAAVYILFDIKFTSNQVWGFNPTYHLSAKFLGLPFEELLFFIVIPYASIFLHDSVVLYFDKLKLSNSSTKVISISLIVISIFIIASNTDKTYTSYIFIKVLCLLCLSFFDKTGLLNRFYITFLIILIPFFIVNGILTGSIINEPVVWYNNQENLGIRMFTIPVEDVFYAFSNIAFVLLLRMKLKQMFSKKASKTLTL